MLFVHFHPGIFQYVQFAHESVKGDGAATGPLSQACGRKQRRGQGHVSAFAEINCMIPVVPHKAVAEERLVVVNQGWQSEATDGLKGA